MANVIAIDIDGVLTEETDTHHEDLSGTYQYRSPRQRAKDVIMAAFREGWVVQLFTGRREAQRRITEDWLHANGFHFHFLTMGKPYFRFMIDDRILGATVEQQFQAFEALLDAERSEDDGNSERRGASGEATTTSEEPPER